MSFYINLDQILNNIASNISKKETVTELTSDEKKKLQELGITDPSAYKTLMEQIGAENDTERQQVLEELEKLIKRIQELAPEAYDKNIAELISKAGNVKNVQELFTLFTDKITILENEKLKDPDVKTIERLALKNQSYSEQMSTDDYNELINILSRHSDWGVKTEQAGNGTTSVSFNCSGKSYTFSINQDIDTSKINDINSNPDKQRVLAFEAIIKDFALGKLRWSDLEEALAPYGFTKAQLMTSEKYDWRNNGYLLTLNYGGKQYSFNCNIDGSVDGTNDKHEGNITYNEIEHTDLYRAGFTSEEIKKYFVEAFVVDGKVQFYTKNETAWKDLGVTSGNIQELKQAIERPEKITKLVNEVIDSLVTKHTLTAEQEKNLREYADTKKADISNMYDGAKGNENTFKTNLTSMLEAQITNVIKPPVSDTRTDNNTVTNELSDAQKQQVTKICDTVATAVGLNNPDKDNLKNLVQTAAADWKDKIDTDFAFEVQKKALEIAQGILKQKNQSSGNNGDLDELISNFTDSGNHSPAVLSELKKYHDNGDISITITRDGSSYEVTITRNGETLGPELVDEQTLRDAGFTINSGVVDLSATTQTYINDIEKSEALLEICRGFMTNGVSINDNNKGKLTFKQTMDVYSQVKADTSYTKSYTNLDTFKDTISKIANEYAVASIQAGTRTEKDATAEQIDEAVKNLTSWGGQSSYNLEGILPATTDDRHDSYPLTSKDFKELYNNDYIVRLHISMDSSESWEDAGKTINRQLNQLGDIITSALGTTNLFDKDILEIAKNNIIKKYSDTKFNNAINDDDDGTSEYDLENNLAWRMKNDRSGTGHRVVGTRDDDGSDSWVWGVRFKDIVDDIIAEYKRLAGYSA